MDQLDVQPYLDRAREELWAVEVNIREELYAVAISRCYYAMFYAVSGLLASIGNHPQQAFRCHCCFP